MELLRVSVLLLVSGISLAQQPEWEEECSDKFRRYYSLDQRVFDHLRALQYLRTRADWWDGTLYVWGWSDGASIAVRVAAYSPETVRSVFGGLGGGITMAQDFENQQCGDPETELSFPCFLIKERLEEIRKNPTTERTWMEDSNSWMAWKSRLDGLEANILVDIASPFLLVHGSESAEIGSAHALVEVLNGRNGPSFEAWEVPEWVITLGRSLRRRLIGSALRCFAGFSVKTLVPAGHRPSANGDSNGR